jgi:hypothetical protein
MDTSMTDTKALNLSVSTVIQFLQDVSELRKCTQSLQAWSVSGLVLSEQAEELFLLLDALDDQLVTVITDLIKTP